MDCAKNVKIYAKNVKWDREGCGKQEKTAPSFPRTPPACARLLVNLTSSICYYPDKGQLVYATWSEVLSIKY